MAATIQTNFVPEIWSARFTSRLDDALVWGSLTNTNYEGDIAAAGDKVKIPTPTTTVTVRDYVQDTNIMAAEITSGTSQDLDIDQQKYFHFYVDDIDRAQAQPNIMDDAMGRAARSMALTVDTGLQGIFNGAYDASRRAAAIGDAITTAAFGTSFLKAVTKLKRMMTMADIPMEDRWLVVHPETVEGIENHFVTNDATGVFTPATDEQTLRNGFSGMLLGFRLLATRRTPDGTAFGSGTPTAAHRLLAGQGTEAVTLARQIVQNEAYRPEARFGEAVKGLMVYGYKLVHSGRLFSIEHRKAA